MRNGTRFIVLYGLLLCGCGSTESSSSEAPPSATTARASTAPSTTRAVGEQPTAEERLHGTWIADDVDVSMGQVKIKLTFRDDGPMKLAAWSDIPFVGQVRDKTGPYEVHGNHISSQAIRGGTSVEFWFDAGDLIIKYKEGKTVRFHRSN